MKKPIRYTAEVISSAPKDAVLVIAFEGNAGNGTAGNDDAAFIISVIKDQIARVNPSHLLVNFSKLNYAFGNMMMKATSLKDEYFGDYISSNIKKVIVVKQLDKQNIFSKFKERLLKKQKLYFDDVDDALRYLSHPNK